MRVLLVTYEFPPRGGPGVQRPVATARYLAEGGWDVTVLTVSDPPTSLRDDAPLAGLPEGVRVERAWSLEPTRFVQMLRRCKGWAYERVRPSDAPSARAAATPRGYTGLTPAGIRLVQALFVPDEKLWWTPWAVSLGRRLHRETPFDCILASGPPFTALGVARRLARDCGVPWVADLRDPIVDGYFFRPSTPLHGRLMRDYERRALHSAARTITVTEGMREDIVRRHPGLAMRVIAIANGFDPRDFSATAPAPHPGFEVAYVGTFQGPIVPDTLLAAVGAARSQERDFGAAIKVALVGPRDPRTDTAVEASGVADVVERTGFVGHAEAIRRMRSAAVLVVILGNDDKSRSILTGKLPEYLGAGRPVLALVPADGEAADLVRRAGAGWVVAPGDVEGTARALLEGFRQWRTGTLPAPDPGVVASFERPLLVAAVGRLLVDVVGGGRAS